MTLEERQIYLSTKLKEARTRYKTILLLGEEACRLFKLGYKGEYYTLKTADDVREFKDRFYYESNDPLIFEDLSLMTKEVQASLLKFIEEPVRPLLVLCSKDNLSGAMMSRFMTYIKIEEPIKCKFISIDQFIDTKMSAEEKKKYNDRHPEDQQSYTDDEQLILTNLEKACLYMCPDYWYWHTYVCNNAGHIHNPDRYIRLMFTTGG